LALKKRKTFGSKSYWSSEELKNKTPDDGTAIDPNREFVRVLGFGNPSLIYPYQKNGLQYTMLCKG
jgi:hypothetical protein